jgi:hypothetical protein
MIAMVAVALGKQNHFFCGAGMGYIEADSRPLDLRRFSTIRCIKWRDRSVAVREAETDPTERVKGTSCV